MALEFKLEIFDIMYASSVGFIILLYIQSREGGKYFYMFQTFISNDFIEINTDLESDYVDNTFIKCVALLVIIITLFFMLIR